jgi:hypothetical protein
MKHIIVILLIILVVVLYCQSYYEGFTTPYGPYDINEFKGGNGSAPPGVNALPGKQQMTQNATSAHVASFTSTSCPAAFAEYKRQPY